MASDASESLLRGFAGLTTGAHRAANGCHLSFHHTPASRRAPGSPVILLLHGYPQSRIMWRHAIPPLAARGLALFVPDLPGYGDSELGRGACGADRSGVAAAIFDAVRAVFGDHLDVVLIGHDRGARLAQRVATPGRGPVVDGGALRLRGALLMDIVPYAAQWAAMGAHPRAAAVAYFHWSFLPAPLSSGLIRAYGAERFCRELFGNKAGKESLFADGAVDHYARLYARESVLEGARADYCAGAAEDWEADKADVEAGRKIEIPTVVLYSARNLGAMHGDVEAIWRRYASDLKVHAIGDDVGHYLPEEAPDEINAHIERFLNDLNV
ncbi:Alpha/Beta hydrolase protein [Xylariomycetidae sp. FL0641]|nr:Alpha/Beta hydrolase protein [Xylariomycetidae sp. FL0641]